MRKTMQKALAGKSYVGRGIVLGKSKDGKKAVFAYFISGRSANSRNRIFVEDGDGLRTEPFDAGKVEDPSLIIYSPVKVVGSDVIVTNGDQTDTIEEYLKAGKCFRGALKTRVFEPDGPNFTPRISGILHLKKPFSYELSILKSADKKGKHCNRFFYNYEPVSGTGHLISTYAKDGNPLPSFTGEPVPVLVPNDLNAFADEIWNALDPENKLSLYCRAIDLKTGETENILINKYEK